MKNLSGQVGVYRRSDFKLIPIGSVFGSLTVIENTLKIMSRSRPVDACRLRCECGNKIVRRYSVLKRDTKNPSCGCQRYKTRKEQHALIPVGTKFGRWTVIENGLYRTCGKTTARACRVRCECGKEAIRWSGSLNSDKTKSCSCSWRTFPQNTDDNFWHKLYTKLRRGNFHLTYPETKILVQMSCFYCGKEPSNSFCHRNNGGRKLRYSGIDRIDPKKDYVRGNVVPCCWTCNRMKSALPLAEFLHVIERICSRHHSVAKFHQQAATIFAVSS